MRVVDPSDLASTSESQRFLCVNKEVASEDLNEQTTSLQFADQAPQDEIQSQSPTTSNEEFVTSCEILHTSAMEGVVGCVEQVAEPTMEPALGAASYEQPTTNC
ncbi:hypothetical protein CYMTET_46307 [Cymbomonas tetramitiformis]|uniref:Uncharacterized protein n=1 Tax=Cymbomonas tetramitiformis TaxID=36881 RepID=A0AAE0BXM2_9CHLO|nr:hypothetical protein CYMTET_46307 [Cymbomonas tetramitiformis]